MGGTVVLQVGQIKQILLKICAHYIWKGWGQRIKLEGEKNQESSDGGGSGRDEKNQVTSDGVIKWISNKNKLFSSGQKQHYITINVKMLSKCLVLCTNFLILINKVFIIPQPFYQHLHNIYKC